MFIKKYTLTKFCGSYICVSMYKEYNLETYIKELERELVELEGNNKVDIFFNIIANEEGEYTIIKTEFENKRINYVKLVLGD